MSESDFQFRLPMHFAMVPEGRKVAGIDIGTKTAVLLFTNWDVAAEYVDDKPQLEVVTIDSLGEMVRALQLFTQMGFTLAIIDPSPQAETVVSIADLTELRRLVLAEQAHAN